MIDGIDWSTVATCGGIAAIGGGFYGFAGFGAGLIMAPIMMAVMKPVEAVPLLVLLSIASAARMIPEARKDWVPKRIAQLAVPSVCAFPFGVWALSSSPGETIHRIVSGVVLLVVLLLWRGFRFKGTIGPAVNIPMGLTSGFLTGLGGVGGPPIVLTLMSEELPPAQIRANLVGYFAILQVTAILYFSYKSMFTLKIAVLALCIAPIFLAAIHVGAGWFGGNQQRYRPVALTLLALVGLSGLLL